MSSTINTAVRQSCELVDNAILTNMRRNVFSLEYELNKHKHAAYRANKKTKLLEKKLHAILTHATRERQEFIAILKSMLAKQ